MSDTTITPLQAANELGTNVPRKLRGKPFQKGHDARRIISPGRVTDDFKVQMRALASADSVFAALSKILSDHTHPHFVKALAFCADRGYGKPQQYLDVTSGGEPITVVSGVPESPHVPRAA